MAGSYGFQNLAIVVRHLATHEGGIRERLMDKVGSIGAISPERDLPESERDEFVEITKALTQHGSMPDTIEALPTDKIQGIVVRIVDMHDRLRSSAKE